MEAMAGKIAEAAETSWDSASAVRFILSRHTWDKRAEVYDKVIRENFPKTRA
jgi:hypothetical protein